MSNIDDMSLLVGRLEAGLDSLNKNLEKVVEKVDSIDGRLAHLERAELERRGATKALIFFAGVVGAVITKIGAIVSYLLGR